MKELSVLVVGFLMFRAAVSPMFSLVLDCRQGSHFVENQGMSGNSVLTGMSGNFAVCQGFFLRL